MLGAIRRQLRLIRYYSAPRRRDRKAIIFERTAVAALVLCVPLTFLIDRTIRRDAALVVVDGTLLVDDDGTYRATVIDATGRMEPVWPDATPVAAYNLTLHIWHYGWPIITSRSRAAATLELKRFGQTPRSAKAMMNDPNVRAAFDDALRERGPQVGNEPPGARAFAWTGGPRVHMPLGWVYGSIIWFAVLSVVIVGPMMLIELGLYVRYSAREVRSAARRDRGLCTACGYDLTGSEFSERCPECGTLV